MSNSRHWWINLLGFQSVWLAVVFGASQGWQWLGVAAALLFVLATFRWGGKSTQDLRMIAICLPIGFALDSSLVYFGQLDYALDWPSGSLAPLWIMALWLGFAATLNHSMGFLHNNPWMAAAFGFIGGPLSYFGAARAFSVVEFEGVMAFVWLAIGWGLALPGIVWLFRRMGPEARR